MEQLKCRRCGSTEDVKPDATIMNVSPQRLPPDFPHFCWRCREMPFVVRYDERDVWVDGEIRRRY